MDAFVQVAPDSTGKKVDMDQVSTGADPTVYRQKAAIVGDVGDAILQLLTINQQQLAVLRAILATLQAESNSVTIEEDFTQPS